MCARGSWKRGPPSGRSLSLGRFHVGPVRRTHRQWGEIGREGEEVAAAPIPWTTVVWTARKVRLASAVVHRLSVSQPLGAGSSGLHSIHRRNILRYYPSRADADNPPGHPYGRYVFNHRVPSLLRNRLRVSWVGILG
jgi:hypothetical protein